MTHFKVHSIQPDYRIHILQGTVLTLLDGWNNAISDSRKGAI